MVNSRAAIGLAVLLVAGCSDISTNPTPLVSGTSAARNSVGLVSSFNVPIPYANGITFDAAGTNLYLSTGSGFRPTYKLTYPGLAVTTIPTGGEPRDITRYGADLLFGDLNGLVIERTTAGALVNSFAVPFRAAGVATDGATIWVGDFDANQILSTSDFGATYTIYPSAVRTEAMVLDPSSNTLWAITPFPGDHNIYEMSTTGQLIRTCDSPYDGGAFGLGGITIRDDTLYVSEPTDPANPAAGTTVLVLDKTALVCTPPLATPVALEISPAHLNLRGNGLVTAFILGSSTFDATTVDISTVRFGHNGTEAEVFLNQGTTDINNDGFLDKRVAFRIRDTGILCADTQVYLTGKTTSGQAFLGTGTIALQKICFP